MQNKVQPLTSSAVPGAERSEAERSETERSAAVGTAEADPTATVRPNPEVVAKSKRRRFTAKYKQQILTKADQATGSGRHRCPPAARRSVLVAPGEVAA